jgi:hypothetical protein
MDVAVSAALFLVSGAPVGPGWTRTQIEAAIDDAERGRAAITTVFRTDQAPAEKIARDLLDWAVSF